MYEAYSDFIEAVPDIHDNGSTTRQGFEPCIHTEPQLDRTHNPILEIWGQIWSDPWSPVWDPVFYIPPTASHRVRQADPFPGPPRPDPAPICLIVINKPDWSATTGSPALLHSPYRFSRLLLPSSLLFFTDDFLQGRLMGL